MESGFVLASSVGIFCLKCEVCMQLSLERSVSYLVRLGRYKRFFERILQLSLQIRYQLSIILDIDKLNFLMNEVSIRQNFILDISTSNCIF